MKLRLAVGLLISSCLLPHSSFADTNAVARGLAWLASQQHADGSWSTNVALNSLPVLAFLSAGQVPGTKPYGERIEKAVRFILTEQASDGTFTNGDAMMYGHGMTTLLLAEISGMGQHDLQLQAPLEKAVQVILRAQAIPKGDIHAGGWRYFPDSKDSDLAVTVWQVAALRAALAAGIRVPKESAERAAHYIDRCEHPRGGFAYQPGGFVNAGRTAAAMLALRMCNHFEDPAIDRARVWLRAHPLRWKDEYVYHSAFFCALAGLAFDPQMLLKVQNADGSWPVPPDSPDEVDAGPLYTTSMAVLALTASNHYLPVFSVND